MWYYILNNVTLKKHKKEMATKYKNGHKINVQIWYVQDSFVILLFQNDECYGNAVFLCFMDNYLLA